MFLPIAVLRQNAILQVRERAAFVLRDPTSFTPRTLLGHGGGPTLKNLTREKKVPRSTGIHKMVAPLVKDEFRPTAGKGEAMNGQHNEVPTFVTQARACFLLGIPEPELSRISRESGLGHVERAGDQQEIYFTYEELRQICQLANQMAARH